MIYALKIILIFGRGNETYIISADRKLYSLSHQIIVQL